MDPDSEQEQEIVESVAIQKDELESSEGLPEVNIEEGLTSPEEHVEEQSTPTFENEIDQPEPHDFVDESSSIKGNTSLEETNAEDNHSEEFHFENVTETIPDIKVTMDGDVVEHSFASFENDTNSPKTATFDADFGDFEENPKFDADFGGFEENFGDFEDFEKTNDFSFGEDLSRTPVIAHKPKEPPVLFDMSEEYILNICNNKLSQIYKFDDVRGTVVDMHNYIDNSSLILMKNDDVISREQQDTQNYNVKEKFGSLNRFCPNIQNKMMSTILRMTHNVNKLYNVSSYDNEFDQDNIPFDLDDIPSEELGAYLVTRDWIVNDIISNEQEYIIKLDNVIKRYHDIIIDTPENEFVLMFANMKQLLRQHNILIKELRDRIDKWDNNQLIGDLFISMAPSLDDVYQDYCVHFEEFIVKFENVESPDGIESWVSKSGSSQDELLMELVSPLKRIPQYIHQLEELLMHTWRNHEDFKNISKSLEQFQLIVSTTLGHLIFKVMQKTNNSDLFQELNKLKGLATETPSEEPKILRDTLTVETALNNHENYDNNNAVAAATIAGSSHITPGSSSYRFVKKLFIDQHGGMKMTNRELGNLSKYFMSTISELSLELTQQLDEFDELNDNRTALMKRIFVLCPSALARAVTPSQQKRKSGYAYTIEANI